MKELSRLVRLGLLPSDAAVSQRKFSHELNQSMRLGLMLSDTPLVRACHMMWLPSPGKESAQTHECLAHLPRSITFNDTVKVTYTGVCFGVFLMVFRELQFGKSGFASELLRWF